MLVCGIAATFYGKTIHTTPSQETSSQSKDFFDVKPGTKPVSYIYAPGMMATEMLMGRYCPEYTASTGEKFVWKSGGHVIGAPHTAVIFSEIDLLKPNQTTFNPLRAFLNRVRGDLMPFIQRMFQDFCEFSVVDNPQSPKSVVNYSFDFTKANIGQRKDIQAMCKTYQEHIRNYPNTDIVLYGDSRGAATSFNFIATHNPKNIKAVVLDSVFDSVPHCIKHFMYEDKDPRAEERLHDIINLTMGGYSKKGPFPRDYAEQMQNNIPILFVTSLKDGLVYPQCTMYLYNRLKERGHKNVHILVLKKQLHPCYMMGDNDDKKTYEAVVHAFYKQYGLPHNSQKAELGKEAFAQTQPSKAELKALYQLPTCTYCNL